MPPDPVQTQLPREGGGGGGGVGQDHVNTDFADSALLLPLKLYGEKRRPFLLG